METPGFLWKYCRIAYYSGATDSTKHLVNNKLPGENGVFGGHLSCLVKLLLSCANSTYRMAASLTSTVIRAVADAENLDPMELMPPLGTVVDIESLENYLVKTKGTCRATFEYHGWRIRVSSDFDVELEPLPQEE